MKKKLIKPFAILLAVFLGLLEVGWRFFNMVVCCKRGEHKKERKKWFEPCEIRIDETERFETLEGKIISYSIPNEHYKNIGDGHTDSYMTYRNEDYDKLYISFLIGDGTDCTDEVSIKNHYKKIYKQMSNIKFESKCNKKYVHFLTENGEVLLSFIDNGYVEFFMCIPYNIERKVQKESIEQYLKMLFSIKIEDK